MSDYQVSSEPCRLYNTGKLCLRSTQSPGCPYVHDNVARKDALKKKRLAWEEQKLRRKVAASRAMSQDQHKNDLPAKTFKGTKQVSGQCENTVQISSKIEGIINQASTDIQDSTVDTLSPNIISNMVTKINNIKLEDAKVTPFETIHQLRWATVIYSKPVAQLAKAHSDMMKFNHKICKFSRAGYCRKGAHCDFRHDHSSLNVAKALSPKSAAVAETAQVASMQAKELAAHTSTAFKGIVVSGAIYPGAEPSKPLVIACTHPAYDGLIDFNKNSWDTYNTLAGWASKNLRLTTATKLLTPYIVAGKIPRRALFGGPTKASDSAVFHFFQQLPTELRIKIWGSALKNHAGGARVYWKWDDYHMCNYYGSRLASMNPPPPFVHVNKEARGLACCHYALTFGTMQAAPETFFNYEQDRVFLHTAYPNQILPMTKLFLDHERNLIQYLQVPLRDFIHNQKGFVDSICRFRDLKILYLAVADTREDEHWARDPRMGNKVTRALEKLWVWRQKTAHQPAPVPTVYINLLDGLSARYYGIDGITWGGKDYS